MSSLSIPYKLRGISMDFHEFPERNSLGIAIRMNANRVGLGHLSVAARARTDNGMHGTMCGRVRTKHANDRRQQVPEVRRLVDTTSAGT